MEREPKDEKDSGYRKDRIFYGALPQSFELVIGDGDRPGQAHPHTLLRKFQIGHCLPDGLGCLPARLQSAEIEDRHKGHELAGLGLRTVRFELRAPAEIGGPASQYIVNRLGQSTELRRKGLKRNPAKSNPAQAEIDGGHNAPQAWIGSERAKQRA